MYCTQCGKEQVKAAVFCHNCGWNNANHTVAQKNNVNTANTNLETAEKSNEREFYIVSVGKFLLLSTMSWGLYPIFWFTKNWNLIKDQEKSNINPIGRAIFGFLYFSDLSSKVLKSAKQRTYDRSYSPGLLAVGYFILNILFKLPDYYWFLGFLSLLTFIPVLEAILFNNEKSPHRKTNYDSYKTGEIIVIVLGSIWWILVLIGIFG